VRRIKAERPGHYTVTGSGVPHDTSLYRRGPDDWVLMVGGRFSKGFRTLVDARKYLHSDAFGVPWDTDLYREPVAVAPGMMEVPGLACLICGSIVVDTGRHTAWHQG
jgi:hypothetical protein